MDASDTWNVEINILAYENEMFSLPTDFHFDVQYLEKLNELHNYLSFLPKNNKDRKRREACSSCT